MNPEQAEAIKDFKAAVQKLKRAGVVRSDRILGDIGEFLCASHFGIELESNLREQGHDGRLNSALVQIKYHGGKSTTVNLGDPSRYEEAFVVLGPESVLRPEHEESEYIVYRLDSKSVARCETSNGNHHCTKARLPTEPSARITLLV
ncbi:DUF6998 domain-containing protein [Marinimicrobium alkaliphilum]|uniref:DUF6998 domain-containing protein n=1 Tax=Marinimicrobium alkaliphilum TaxID=2202654 RepID=UPI0018E0B6D7|nr:hypothetical protein [Marinimicrobium alkaliphilum]